MKWISAAVVSVALAGLLPLEGRAAFNITWDTGQPITPAAGKVTGTGTFSIDDTWTLTSMTIYAYPVTGGSSEMQPCSHPSPPAFSGMIVGLPTGEYYIIATLVESKGMAMQTTSTKPVALKVP